jgi:hypothetical protein
VIRSIRGGPVSGWRTLKRPATLQVRRKQLTIRRSEPIGLLPQETLKTIPTGYRHTLDVCSLRLELRP